jgi:Dolichyl-phosphate-mannose-protein mannosyltransferase
MRRSERSLSSSTPTVSALALAAAGAFLLIRLVPDVHGKPLFEDEAVAGLIAARPFGEALQTAVLDRGGAPLHFVLAHVALAAEASPDSLRWLSVVFAVATIPVCYDLARRLAGAFAGIVAAALAATSQSLAIYGTFGRMYSLFAFASALALDLFVLAIERPERTTQLAATVAAFLPLAVHPFGVFLFAAELVVATWLWGRKALLVAILAIPFLLPDFRLADRYVGADLGGKTPVEAALRALGGAAGGYSVPLLLFAVFAVLGITRRWLGVLGLLVIAVPPVALTVTGALDLTSDHLSPRHLIFMLPLWIALVAAGVARLPFRVPLAAALVVVATLAPAAVSDPRTVERADNPTLPSKLERGDVMYPYSPVFLAALPQAAKARGFPRERVALARITRRTRNVPKVFVALPDGHAWRILERAGPYATGVDALAAIVDLLRDERPTPAVLQLRAAASYALATSTGGASPQSSSSR